MNSGKYVFAQIAELIKMTPFRKLVKKFNGDYRAHDLTCYNQFLHLLFGQLSPCTSLRDICMFLKAHESCLFHMGFGNTVDHTTLSRANEKRDYRIYEELGYYLIKTVRPLFADEKLDDINTDLTILALDSTTISVSIKLCEWALGKYERGDIKMHTLLDLRGSIPVQIHITDGRWHDSNMWDEVKAESFTMYAADKAYVDLDALRKINLANAFFVVRPKSNMKFVFKEELTSAEKDSNIVGDYIVEFARKGSKEMYPDELRMVRAIDTDTGEIIDFMTNNFGLLAPEVANIYRHRWDIEVFFRWIKQNIVIKKLWGYSHNAVKTQLWVAICAYLMLAWVKKIYNSDYSITDIATIISGSLVEKADLGELLTHPSKRPGYLNSNQNVKELTLF